MEIVSRQPPQDGQNLTTGSTTYIPAPDAQSKIRSHYMRDVLTGAAGTTHEIIDQFAKLGWDIGSPLVVVVAQLDDPPDPASVSGSAALERLTAAWQQVLHDHDRAEPVASFTREAVALMGASDEAIDLLVQEVVASVRAALGRDPVLFATGVSMLISAITELPLAYQQARTAVHLGRLVHGPGSLVRFDALGGHRVLSLVPDQHALRSFAIDVLGSLARDTPETTDLRATMRNFIDKNCSVAVTARALGLHYNTLRYRIGKLESIVGPFIDDPDLRLDVTLALRIMDMHVSPMG